jgi:hypothetical protein
MEKIFASTLDFVELTIAIVCYWKFYLLLLISIAIKDHDQITGSQVDPYQIPSFFTMRYLLLFGSALKVWRMLGVSPAANCEGCKELIKGYER